MEKLFPGDVEIQRQDRDGNLTVRMSDEIDWKARVVCKKCNETWMSNIESQHAEPVLTPLITGELDLPIGLAEARSIALFSFKTAVVLDHANRRAESPFFDRRSRHLFRKSLAIPISVQMWLCGFIKHRGNGRFTTLYHKPETASGDSWLMYVCTCADRKNV